MAEWEWLSFAVDMLCVAELDGRFQEVNAAWTRTLGWSRDELLARAWLDLVHADDRERTRAALESLRAEGEIRCLENRCACKDGGYRWLSWSSSPLPGGDLIVSAVRDVTESREAERQLRLIQTSIQRSPMPTFWIGSDARPRFVNDAACRSLGYSADELKTLRVWEFDPTFTPERWSAHRGNLVSRGHRTIESTHRRKDGSVFPVEISVHIVEFEGEQLSVSFVRDISERKRDEEERARSLAREQAARAEAQEANRAKDRFLAVLSHELRNPLAAIVMSLELLKRCVHGQDARVEHAIEIASRNARLEARLLDDLLDLSRVVRGMVTLRRSPLRLDRVVRLALEPQQREAVAAGIELEVQTQPDLWVDADPDRLQQVVTNLLANAVNFTRAGGRIRVSVHADGDSGRIVIADSGIGIEPARLPALFDTMFQHAEGGSGRKTGLGIGLALVKSIVGMHSGRVWAESEGLGKGSRFTVELPLVAAPTIHPRPPSHTTPAAEPPVSVLLVEDNADTREVLSEDLRLLGHRVTTASSAEEALALLATTHPDVIVADIGLPGLNGYEMLRQARGMLGVTAPAFALTGFGQSNDMERSRSAGFQEHMVKPVDLAYLDVRIRAWAHGTDAQHVPA